MYLKKLPTHANRTRELKPQILNELDGIVIIEIADVPNFAKMTKTIVEFGFPHIGMSSNNFFRHLIGE